MKINLLYIKMSQKIGRGTWIDKVADQIIKREKKLNRKTEIIRVESGLGASGIPHVGSMGDAVRAFGVKNALIDRGYKAELITYADDMDGLRKIPEGLPETLKKYLGFPVSKIPDPFNTHDSYGEHMSSMLKDALDLVEIEYTHESGTKAYKNGILNNQIIRILENSELIGEKISDMLGQEKFQHILPYYPICNNCNRLYVAQSYEYKKKEKKILYRCKNTEIGRNILEGCGHDGEVDVTKGKGKLSWKGEFAARWAALDIRFEAYGKDIEDSVRINDWISNNILNYFHPHHIRYELFLNKSGKKISKSIGNVLTPQIWLKYGSTKSLLLLMFKRISGTRNIDVEDIPRYMDEYDALEDTYFLKTKTENQEKLDRLRGLYEYVNKLEKQNQIEQHIPYNLLVQLCQIAPKDSVKKYVLDKLENYKMINKVTNDLENRIEFCSNWSNDFKQNQTNKLELEKQEELALKKLIIIISKSENAEDIQNGIFNISKEFNITPKIFFNLLYNILINSNKGPRLGHYIIDIGKEAVIERIKASIQ